MPQATGTSQLFTLFPALTTTGTSIPVDLRDFGVFTVTVIGVGTISAGTLIIEEADYDPLGQAPYSGTWSQIDSIDCTAVSGGKTESSHEPVSAPGAYVFSQVRGRFSVDISGAGGSVTVLLRAR